MTIERTLPALIVAVVVASRTVLGGAWFCPLVRAALSVTRAEQLSPMRWFSIYDQLLPSRLDQPPSVFLYTKEDCF